LSFYPFLSAWQQLLESPGLRRGNTFRIKSLYLKDLQRVRKGWPVIEIKDADHITCILKPPFKKEIHKWLAGQKRR
jgi:hypothetical protein